MELYKPTFKRQRPDGSEYEYQARNWVCRFRDPTTGKRIKKSTHTADKRRAQVIANDLFDRLLNQAAGRIDPYADHAKKPLAEHLEDWRRALVAKGDKPKTARQAKRRAEKVFSGCSFETWSDISASRVQAYISEDLTIKRGKEAARPAACTRNFHLAAVKQFCRWMVRDRRAAESPLSHLSKENQRVDRRVIRRALDADEQRELLRRVRNEPPRFGMTGEARALLYELALTTGLRAGEIKSLTWEHVDLDHDPATVTVTAANAKGKRADTLPLLPAMADKLRRWREQSDDAGEDAPVIHMASTYNTGRMVREDLDAVRAAWINDDAITSAERRRRKKTEFLSSMNKAGQVVDFHGLRHTFITGLARGGVHPKLAQDLARHTDINLTMSFYTHTLVSERADALSSALPNLDADPDAEENIA